ncbi:cytochrome c family protein [Aromatoleum toluclasticum]|uniref:cytochrome c family protein n=1 Tax=Aromatoleum toluclasticum TaxID=92003 RepID=UPI001D19374E|nr:cytochrome c family protein [Aromatoleum toluclasticum]MCC4116272.1 cytochrome c family protein [Aromatoleum toluclasticum]
MASGNGVVKWIVTALTLTLAACGPDPRSPPLPSSPATAPADHESFLKRHWARPLAPQGAPPAGFGPQEASLAPAACGQCHAQQFEDWQTALHSKAMGPGLVGQLQEMDAGAVDDHQACLRCHAPLAEQQADLQQTLAASGAVSARADGAAFTHGLTCAGCHVRQNQRFGPARRDGSSPAAGSALPHAGWQVSAAFEDSRFCAACHQFEPDGFSLNGKLLENTYEEWRASRYGRDNQNCQSCHMPDRRHLWRGIHDPEMVRSGLAIEFAAPSIAAGGVTAALTIASRGVGHAFPTYVTPQVIVEIGQAGEDGALLAETVERHLIARDVSLDLSEERSDTRILPDEVRRYAYDRPLAPNAATLVARIRVEPDAFYAEFYRATLRDPDFSKGREALSAALRQAEGSNYVLYESRRELNLSKDG